MLSSPVEDWNGMEHDENNVSKEKKSAFETSILTQLNLRRD